MDASENGNASNDGRASGFLTARQLADVLQVSETTVRRLARAGRIPSVRLTSRILRFRLKQVINALENESGDATKRRRQNSQSAKADDLDDRQMSFTDLSANAEN